MYRFILDKRGPRFSREPHSIMRSSAAHYPPIQGNLRNKFFFKQAFCLIGRVRRIAHDPTGLRYQALARKPTHTILDCRKAEANSLNLRDLLDYRALRFGQ